MIPKVLSGGLLDEITKVMKALRSWTKTMRVVKVAKHVLYGGVDMYKRSLKPNKSPS